MLQSELFIFVELNIKKFCRTYFYCHYQHLFLKIGIGIKRYEDYLRKMLEDGTDKVVWYDSKLVR